MACLAALSSYVLGIDDCSIGLAGEAGQRTHVLSTSFDENSERGIIHFGVGDFERTEANTFFTVLTGKAIVSIVDGPTFTLEASVVGEFNDGVTAQWCVQEPLILSFQRISKVDALTDQESCALPSDTIELRPEAMELGASWVESGSPAVSSTILSTISLADCAYLRGLWRCTEGAVTYVEEDELFTVLAGWATVSVRASEMADATVLELRKGSFGEFKKGDIATFTVHQDFLKTFQITLNSIGEDI